MEADNRVTHASQERLLKGARFLNEEQELDWASPIGGEEEWKKWAERRCGSNYDCGIKGIREWIREKDGESIGKGRGKNQGSP